jgi:signal transduction histidine kinase
MVMNGALAAKGSSSDNSKLFFVFSKIIFHIMAACPKGGHYSLGIILVLEWNNFAFLSLICFLMSSVSALLTLAAKRKGAPLLFGLMCLVLAFWSLGLFFCFSATESTNALFWARLVNHVMVFLPALVFHFVVEVVGKKVQFQRSLWLYYAISCAYLFSILLFPESFLHSPRMRFEQFWFPLGGTLFYFFPILFLLVIGHAIQLLVVSRAGEAPRQKLKIDYLLMTIVVGLLGGGASMSLEFNIDIQPYWILTIAAIVVISTYAVLKHELLELPETISVVIARLLIYIFIFSFVVLILNSDFLFGDYKLLLSQVMMIAFLIVLACEFYASVKGKIQTISDKMLVRKKVTSQKVLKVLLDDLDGAADFEAMLPIVRSFFEEQSYMHHYAWYLDQVLLEHTLKKRTIQDFERARLLDDSVYQRILFSANDGRRHDKLPAILRSDASLVDKGQTAKQQMINLMSSEQLDPAYSWVDKVPGRETIGLPIIADSVFRGLLLIVVSRTDIRPSDQEALQAIAGKLAAVIEKVEFFRRQSVQQQAFLLEKMESLQALAGSIAHEMRTPLMQLDHFVNVVNDHTLSLANPASLEPAEGSVSKELTAQTKLAKTSIERSLQVIDITLGLVKNQPIDASKFQSLSIQSVVTKALAEYIFLLGERDWVRCDLRQNFTFKGDETLLIYTLFNLLKNSLNYALNYTHSASDFEIQITSLVEEEFNVLVFRDNGPGVSSDVLTHIFEDFFSGDGSYGSGLGLAYCRRVMNAFNGDISCTSELGQFTEFKMRFLPIDSGGY